jgi:acetyl esterase/lipase
MTTNSRRWIPAIGLALVLTSIPALALAGDRTRKNVSYSPAGGARTRLDVYAPPSGETLPVVVWIHGGGWQRGNRSLVGDKPSAFNAKGYVLVSIDYRMVPDVDVKQQAADVAHAIAWVKAHIAESGGDPGRIALMGHSSGAHMAALVGTDESYLEAAGCKLSDLSGVILLDGAGYDIPKQMSENRIRLLGGVYSQAFSDDPAKQKALSPIEHVKAGKGIPPFLILHVASRPDSRAQSEAFGAKLREAGGEARVVAAEGKTHATINREIGHAGDKPTEEVFAFLHQIGSKRPAP